MIKQWIKEKCNVLKVVWALKIQPKFYKSKKWLVIEVEQGNVALVPLNDTIFHTAYECPCGPTDQPEERKDGSMGWLEVHHALDGRE